VVHRFRPNDDVPARGCELERVANEVGNRALQRVRLERDWRKCLVCLEAELDVARARLRHVLLDQLLEQLQRRPFGPRRWLVDAACASVVERALDEPAHPRRGARSRVQL
jgi:hypothetical protein